MYTKVNVQSNSNMTEFYSIYEHGIGVAPSVGCGCMVCHDREDGEGFLRFSFTKSFHCYRMASDKNTLAKKYLYCPSQTLK